jgi:hypothetical protein
MNSLGKQSRIMRDREKQIVTEHQNTNDEFYYSLFSMALAVNTKEHGNMNSKDFKSTVKKRKQHR